MTKQSQAHVSAEEKPPSIIPRRFNLMDAAVDEVRKANLAAGLEPKYSMDLYIQSRASPNTWIHSRTVSFFNTNELDPNM